MGDTTTQCTLILALFPVPRPAFHRLQYGKAVLQATKSWAWDWERGYVDLAGNWSVGQFFAGYGKNSGGCFIGKELLTLART